MELAYEKPYLTPDRTRLIIPQPTLVILCGISGSGKSTFGTTRFPSTWVVSSDHLRQVVCDNPRNMKSSRDAFDLLYDIVQRRLKFGRTTVVDSTSLEHGHRHRLLEIARQHYFQTLLLVFDTPRELCEQRDASRLDPLPVGREVIDLQYRLFRETLKNAPQEGFDQILTLPFPESETVKVEIKPLSLHRPQEQGPFDIIGDVHGCIDELRELLDRLGYREQEGVYHHPAGRRVIFLGDLVNRGPDSPAVIKLALSMVQAGAALNVLGNHDYYLLGHFRGYKGPDFEKQRKWLEKLNPEQLLEIQTQLETLAGKATPYLVLNKGKLVVAHAGVEDAMVGHLNSRVFQFSLHGDDTGEKNERGLKVRSDWSATYRGKAFVAYGHTPTGHLEPQIRNNSVNLDQGCVLGGRLSALRYPEMTFEQVSAARAYTRGSSR